MVLARRNSLRSARRALSAGPPSLGLGISASRFLCVFTFLQKVRVLTFLNIRCHPERSAPNAPKPLGRHSEQSEESLFVSRGWHHRRAAQPLTWSFRVPRPLRLSFLQKVRVSPFYTTRATSEKKLAVSWIFRGSELQLRHNIVAAKRFPIALLDPRNAILNAEQSENIARCIPPSVRTHNHGFNLHQRVTRKPFCKISGRMLDSSALNNSPESSRANDLWPKVASAAAVLVCLFGHLGTMGLVGPDEPRYAWIARAMAQTGDWVTPRLYGQPWFEKPILYYWAAAIGFRLHFPAEWAARLPSAFAALAVAVALGWLSRNFYDSKAPLAWNPALLAPLIFSTSVAAIGFARAATPDMLFTACIALAMASAACILDAGGALRAPTPDASSTPQTALSPRRDALHCALFGIFLGLAVLAKGPAAIILAGGAIGLWALITKHWRAAFRAAHPFAIAAFCIVALPWYILCAMRNPDFLRVFIFQHNFERYLTPLFQHRQPFWFFVPITLLAILPWTALLWPATREGLRRWREKSLSGSPGFFFACWAIFPVLFFSLSQSKLPSYILPSVPPLALLLVTSLTDSIRTKSTGENTSANGNGERRFVAAGIALGVTWIILGVAPLIWMKRLPQAARDASGHAILAAAIIAAAGGIAVAILAVRRRNTFVLVSILLAVTLTEIAGSQILPALDPMLTARPHAELLRRDLHPDRIFTLDLPRSWDYGLAFYLGRQLPEWSPENPDAALVLTTPAGLEKMKSLNRVRGSLDEEYEGILFVPAFPAAR
jgi:4-amino-4-deoxy-L-arabinose transferase-like glycosyltransferase